MKIYYWQKGDGTENFGDDLNRLIWETFIPELIDDDPAITLIPIGTILNSKLSERTPDAKQRLIFSSGFGYEEPLVLDDSHKVYCVRGPLTAKALGLTPDLGIVDGAVLIRKIRRNDNPKKLFKFSYMPHISQVSLGWSSVCEKNGINYIDPRWDTETILTLITQTEVLLCEAMHGSIVADALRVPWIPIVSNPKILKFKWEDWCQSIQVEYQPQYLNCDIKYPRGGRLKFLRQIKCGIQNKLTLRQAALEIVQISKNVKPTLSDVNVLDGLISRLEEKLEILKADIKKSQT
jgi:succinoglycan biosynthesis protein ExoV